MTNKFAWIMSPNIEWEDKKDLITTSLESGIDHVLDLKDLKNIQKLGNISVINPDDDSDIILVGIGGEGDGTLSLDKDLNNSQDLATAKSLKNNGKKIAAYIEIASKSHEQLAVAIGKIADYIILVGKDWTVIPLENIIADLQKRDVKIIAAVSDAEEARLALETLEIGADGILFEPKDFTQIKEIAKIVEDTSSNSYDLKEATITGIRGLTSGDRVCIDTASMMNIGEGMLIGSYSKAMFLVHSESLESEYVASRPFRVNAGPVQAYVMTPGNKTKYLSELETGDEVLVVNKDGKTRPVVVGRVKIEKRPLILIEAEYEGLKIKTLLQNAETIRLVDSKGEAVSVSELKVGDKIKVFIDDSARHFGMAIEETIIEK
ncbi:3-amino-4-hydroxybenzoic acid synthase [Methanobrevibacter cuticularis]|uniref:3-dehydroquinate synthase n=1 Tax=Methanobrevibacter cuticularis TaxID=47311 RepID=A0A166EXH9_9EURY|nr:3-dehydroquinate synthase II [Methanobrevibacter cuticularis]KZX17118.1 3-amino-4-hydroxybenzoic acid synthase [Methanobrevibacter cuticularis]